METALRILVVDDTRTNLVLMETMLKKMGHVPILASDANQGLTLFREQQPDMVLMDVMMPGMDGYEAVREIRRTADSWLPILFISAMSETGDLVKGLEAGGDDYLLKPVDYAVLRAKINIFIERLRMSRLLAWQNRQLLDHQAHEEEERKTAQDFMRKLVALERIDDPAVRFHLQAATHFSGDLIAVARTPSNQLHVLLADSTGHGLTAALAVTPVLQPFHTMSAKGFSIAAIAAEINRKVQEYLPIHRFVAAILISMDGVNQTLSVWNGGCPPVVVLSGEGLPVWQFDSIHVPMGILSPHEFDAKLEHFRIGDKAMCQVVLCSDGAIDALEHTDAEGSMKKLLAGACLVEREQRFPEMVKLLQDSVVSSEAVDDIALIMLDCHALAQSVTAPAHCDDKVIADLPPSPQEEGANRDLCGWRFSMRLTAKQLRELDVVPMLLNLVKQMESEDSKLSGMLFMVLSELFNNALDHGLLKLDSGLKHDPEGMERYFEQREARLRGLSEGEISLEFERSCGHDCYLVICVKDSGEGFDVAGQMKKSGASTENRHGRGILLVRDICGTLEYKGNGSEVVVRLAL